MSDDYFDPTDAEKLEMRYGLSRRVGALMRAWWLGMFRARGSEEEELLGHIAEIVGPRLEQDVPPDATPLGIRVAAASDPDSEPGCGELVRISDGEYLAAFDDLFLRYVRMTTAYSQGMVVATTPAQESQLAELREIFDKEGPQDAD